MTTCHMENLTSAGSVMRPGRTPGAASLNCVGSELFGTDGSSIRVLQAFHSILNSFLVMFSPRETSLAFICPLGVPDIVPDEV